MPDPDQSALLSVLKLHLAAGARVFTIDCRYCETTRGVVLATPGSRPSVWRCRRCGGTNETRFDRGDLPEPGPVKS